MIEGTDEANLCSSTTLISPEEVTFAAQLAQSVGLTSNGRLIRYHPSIFCSSAVCIFVILVQAGFVTLGYFLPEILPAKWLCFAWSMVAVVSFLLAMFAYFIHHRFVQALKALGYLLVRRHFQILRRIPFFIGAFYVLINLAGFSTLALLCPKAMSDPSNSTCETSSLLNRPYWLLYFFGVVGQASLFIISYAVLCFSFISFHRRALRGRVLPDVLSELAQLSASTVLAGQDRADLGNRSFGTPMFTDTRGPEAINTSGDVAETHSRIVNIIDRSNANESFNRVVMDRQADVLFYMHQRIACLQEQLGKRQPEA